MGVNLKSLIARLNATCRGALEGAAGLCLSRTNYDVEPEHFLLKLIESPDTDLAAIFRRYEINQSRVTKDLTAALDKLKTGNARTPGLSPRLPQWIQEAWLLASVDYGAAQVRSGHLLVALLGSDDLRRLAREISREFASVSVESLKKDFAEITASSAEAREATSLSDQPLATGAAAGGPVTGGKTKSLDQFTIDLTARARAGKIDPVLGRDFEIRQVIDVLTRWTTLKDPPLYERMAPAGLNPDGYVNMASLASDVDWWLAHGYIKTPTDPATVVDHSFVDLAIGRLGRYGAP